MFRIGHGYDVHALVSGRKLFLCGVEIPHSLGLLGHSDADVAIHALCDSMLGALALGDIGKHFPDTDVRFKGIDSKILLGSVNKLIKENGYSIGNVDLTIVAQKPKLSPYIQAMRETLAKILECEVDKISVKATTTEHLGFEGEEKGISSTCICLLVKA